MPVYPLTALYQIDQTKRGTMLACERVWDLTGLRIVFAVLSIDQTSWRLRDGTECEVFFFIEENDQYDEGVHSEK